MNQNKELNKGMFWTLFSNISNVGIKFIAMIVLARFLAPEDFAVIGIAVFFISIASTIVDSGMGGSLLQKKDVTDVDFSTLFIYNVAIAVIIYIILLLIAPYISTTYNNPQLNEVINWVGISIIINGLGAIQRITLYRDLRFKTITAISLISSFIGLTVAIVMAIYGYGVMALVAQNLVQASVAVALQFNANRYLPKLVFSKESYKEQAAFGYPLLGANLLKTTYDNIYAMIFPRISSLAFSGFYVQAAKIKDLPIGVINTSVQNAAFPILSKIDDADEFKQVSNSFAHKVYLFSSMMLFYLMVFSKELISVVLGDKWLDSAPILSILSIQALFFLVFVIVRVNLKSRGLTKSILQLQIINILIGLLFIACTMHFGDYAILWGIVMAQFISSLVSAYIYAKKSNYKASEIWLIFVKNISAPLISAIVTFLVLSIMPTEVVYKLSFGSIFYFCCIIIIGYIIKDNIIINLIRFGYKRLNKTHN